MTTEFAATTMVLPSGGARRQFVSDRGAGARVIFDDHGLVVRFADLLAQDARQNVGAAPGRERNDDPDGSAGLRPGRLNERSDARQNDAQRCQLQTFATQDFHRFMPLGPKLIPVVQPYTLRELSISRCRAVAGGAKLPHLPPSRK